jgi:hypothetical protein
MTAPKVAAAFADKNQKFVVLGGAMGKTGLDANNVKALATMPSLDQLRATLAGMLKQPGTRIASILQAAGGQIARVSRRTPRRATKRLRRTIHGSNLRFELKRTTGSDQMADLAKLVDDLSALTVLEASELSKLLEEKWGVSAAAPVAVAAAPAAAAAAAPSKRRLNST